MGNGGYAHRAQPGEMARRAAEQRVAAEAAQELRVVVVDCEAETQPLEALLLSRRYVQASVRKLARERALELAVHLERRRDDPSRNVRVASPAWRAESDSMYGPAGRTMASTTALTSRDS